MPPADVLVQSLASGLLMGLLYALVAVGLSLIWGLMEIVNFAHGEFLMLAMFAAFWAYTLYGWDPYLSLIPTLLLLFLLGAAVYRGIIRYLLKAEMWAQIFATFGLAVFLRSGAQFLWSPDYRTIAKPLVSQWLGGRVELAGIFLGLPQILGGLAALAAFALMYWYVTRTEVGLALQATSEDREAAALMGINSDRMFTLGWSIGIACVGAAGVFLATFFYIQPAVGFTFTILAYAIVALGGFGSIPGALVAALIVGLVEALAGLLVSPSLKYAFVFGVYLAVVLLRPQGLLGKF